MDSEARVEAGRWALLTAIRRQTARLEDLEFAQGVGGIRPQLIDRNQRKLILGQAEIDPGNGIRFNITPSPGATTCLGNAEQDILRIQEHLGCEFDRSWFEAEAVVA